MLKLYRFYWDCGRQGDIEGLFIAEESEVQDAIGQDIYFGEILGKHSEVAGTLEENEITVKSEDQDFIQKLEEVFGNRDLSGYNPLNYLEEEDDDEEE